MEKTQKKAYLYAGAAIFFWATIASAFKLGLRSTGPPTLLLWANGISLLVFLGLILYKKEGHMVLAQSKKYILRSAALGLLMPFGYYLILFEAYSRLPGQVAQPLNMIWPIVLVFLSGWILRQPVRLKSYVALLISFTGIIFVSSQGDLSGFGHTDVTGVLLAAGSSIIWAFFWIFHMKDPRKEEIKLFTNFLFAFIYIVLFVILTGKPVFPPTEAIAAGIYAGFFEMGFTFFFWLKALQLSRTTAMISNLVYLAPFLSLLFIHYLVGEKIFPTTLMGLFLITTGIIFQNYSFNKSSGTKKIQIQ